MTGKEISQEQFYDDYLKVSVMMLADFIKSYKEDMDEESPFIFEQFIEQLAGSIKSYYPDFDEVTFINDSNGW